ncbi:MAG TPA: cobalamin-binding protein [Candidatus Eremiobacteraeota bacterium]|nr:MAG: Vitamin B12-binding protein precursor [bacterium ADurb.Bin363]HPZ06994.1 cobalamin-binding protein [Candidatus Eremiobacteraeota bacterium]
MKKVILYYLLLFFTLSFGVIRTKDTFPLELTDAYGRKIILKSLPQRIISLSPSSTEMIFYLGLSEKLLAVNSQCDFPPEALKKQKIGDVNLNIEKLVELHPDLIVTEKGLFDNLIYQFDSLGLPVLFLDAGNMEGICNSILLLGKATGEIKVSHQLVNSIKERIEEIKIILPNTRKIRVFVEIWPDPVMTVGKKNFINDIISLAGGVNIADDIESNNIQINSEWVLKRDPEVIILTTPGTKARVYKRPAWQEITALKSGRVYEIDPDIMVRPTPRVLIGIKQIAHWLYPGLEF